MKARLVPGGGINVSGIADDLGMVSSCAGCNRMEPWASSFTGIGAGLIYLGLSHLMIRHVFALFGNRRTVPESGVESGFQTEGRRSPGRVRRARRRRTVGTVVHVHHRSRRYRLRDSRCYRQPPRIAIVSAGIRCEMLAPPSALIPAVGLT